MNDQCGPYCLEKDLTSNRSKWGILCLKDGDPLKTIPIMDSDDDSCMATWNSLKEAKAFAEGHILCRISEKFYINLTGGEIDF